MRFEIRVAEQKNPANRFAGFYCTLAELTIQVRGSGKGVVSDAFESPDVGGIFDEVIHFVFIDSEEMHP